MYREDEIISMWSADMYDMDETDITDVNFAVSTIARRFKLAPSC